MQKAENRDIAEENNFLRTKMQKVIDENLNLQQQIHQVNALLDEEKSSKQKLLE